MERVPVQAVANLAAAITQQLVIPHLNHLLIKTAGKIAAIKEILIVKPDRRDHELWPDTLTLSVINAFKTIPTSNK